MERDWEFYLCEVEGKPASVSLDLALRADAPIANLPIRVVFRLNLLEPREDGLSGQGEFARLTEIDELLFEAAAQANAPVLFVGRVTFGGYRDFFFYAADRVSPRTLLATAMTRFPEYRCDIEISAEPGWTTYLDFLYPGPRDRQVIQNRQVLEALARLGDQHEQPREVSHWISFTTAEDRDRFQAAAETRGFRTVSTRDRTGPAGSDAEDDAEPDEFRRPFGLILSRDDAVDYHAINLVVLSLFDTAEACQGEYDGWETKVVKEAPPSS